MCVWILVSIFRVYVCICLFVCMHACMYIRTWKGSLSLSECWGCGCVYCVCARAPASLSVCVVCVCEREREHACVWVLCVCAHAWGFRV
jgi:hypothetical protein